MSSLQSPARELPRNLMLGIAFGQGIALFLLWRALDNQIWPSQTPAVNFPLWTFALAWPVLMLLSLETGNLRRCLQAVSLFTAVLVLLAIYIGWQATPHGEFPIESLLFVSAVTGAIACFKGLMVCQRWIGQTPPSYEHLFRFSWRNFLVFALASLLTVGVNLILFLTGALFSQIGIDFFRELFREDWFLFPVLAVAFGLGVLIFRRLVPVIDTITALLEGLMRLLLPLIAAVVVAFLGALPFTGLEPLWDTGSGTALLLWLNAFGLFFVNAVYQTGRNPSKPRRACMKPSGAPVRGCRNRTRNSSLSASISIPTANPSTFCWQRNAATTAWMAGDIPSTAMPGPASGCCCPVLSPRTSTWRRRFGVPRSKRSFPASGT